MDREISNLALRLYSMGLDHLDNFATIRNARKRLCVDIAICASPFEELIPPAEEEVASNELEPGCEGVACATRIRILQ